MKSFSLLLKYKFVPILLSLLSLWACSSENLYEESVFKSNEAEILIKTFRQNYVLTRSVGEEYTVESFETLVLPELQPHIWLGNLLYKHSLVDCDYSPYRFDDRTITASLTLANTESSVIQEPTMSKYLKYISDQTKRGHYGANDEFVFQIENFTSYNELKYAFGSNVNTSFLFWKNSKGATEEERLVSKATGLYVKFYQTSFKAVMDYPDEIKSLPQSLQDSLVYINSIAYGRLGILAMETNESYAVAKKKTEEIVKKIFSHATYTLTEEEEQFLSGCDCRVYTIGGNSADAVTAFMGYEDFLKYIKKGSFNNTQYGVPIYCTFNHLSDNTPVKVKFKFSINTAPLYVELKYKPLENTAFVQRGDIELYFYRSKARIPTIAPPQVKFHIVKKVYPFEYGRFVLSNKRGNYFQNAGYQTSMLLYHNVLLHKHIPPACHGGREPDCEPAYTEKIIYKLEHSPEYEILGVDSIGKLK